MTDSYYFESGGFPIQGYLLKCPKCGKKIIVEAVLVGVNHNLSVSAVCAACAELTEEFKAEQPEIANQVEAFKSV